MPHPQPSCLLLVLALGLLSGVPDAWAQPGGGDTYVAFPSENETILDGTPERFYMGLERNFGRERVWSWEGGMYGYVRNARQTPAGWRFTRFHEGIDIAPLRRDEQGEPLDAVRAVDAGRVVYVNANPRASDYGRYVVVEHDWPDGPFYTLYAHLASVAVYERDRVARGEALGVVGYSGQGLDRDRAHVHFEVNLLLNQHFDIWRDARNPRWPATHGRYHGLNLAGVSPFDVLAQSLAGDPLSIRELIARQYEDVTLWAPAGPPPDLLTRYPWLCGSCEGEVPTWATSWEVGFTRAGLPVRVEPAERRVATLQLGRVDPAVAADYLASRLLTRPGAGADLSSSARALASLLFARPGMVPTW